MKEKVPVSQEHKLRVEILCLEKDGKAVAEYAKANGLHRFYRCQKCAHTNYFYPHILHMQERHNFDTFQTLSALFEA